MGLCDEERTFRRCRGFAICAVAAAEVVCVSKCFRRSRSSCRCRVQGEGSREGRGQSLYGFRFSALGGRINEELGFGKARVEYRKAGAPMMMMGRDRSKRRARSQTEINRDTQLEVSLSVTIRSTMARWLASPCNLKTGNETTKCKCK